MGLRFMLAEIEALQAASVVQEYALGGAVGATYYVEPSETEDVDIFVLFQADAASTLAPLAPIYEFLKGRGAAVEGAHLVIGDWPVQFRFAGGGLLPEAIADARTVDLDGQRLSVFSAEHLAAIALETGRTKDKLRLAQFLEWSGFDKTRFLDIVERNELVAKWLKFKRVFSDDSQGTDMPRRTADKQTWRDEQASKPFAEKIRILEKLRERARSIRSARIVTPDKAPPAMEK